MYDSHFLEFKTQSYSNWNIVFQTIIFGRGYNIISQVLHKWTYFDLQRNCLENILQLSSTWLILVKEIIIFSNQDKSTLFLWLSIFQDIT